MDDGIQGATQLSQTLLANSATKQEQSREMSTSLRGENILMMRPRDEQRWSFRHHLLKNHFKLFRGANCNAGTA